MTPGLDILLARDLGMNDATQRLHLGHMGCYAALPGLGAASDFVTARGRPAVMLCVELASLHVQPSTPTARSGHPTPQDLQQMVAHALFSDAAAAVVLSPDQPGLEVVDVVVRTDVTTADHMTWDVTDLGFKMGLSPAVPDVLARHAKPVVEELLERRGLAVDDVAGWAVHPGGRKIVEVVGEVLHLDEQHLRASYDVLRDAGNCSSATVLLVLERLQQAAPAQRRRPRGCSGLWSRADALRGAPVPPLTSGTARRLQQVYPEKAPLFHLRRPAAPASGAATSGSTRPVTSRAPC